MQNSGRVGRTRRVRRWVAATIGVALVILGVLGGLSAAAEPHGPRQRASGGGRTGEPAVEIAVARTGVAREVVTLSGVVAASATVAVTAALPGRLHHLAVVPGEVVRAGQLLALVADSLASGQLALAQAAAVAANAKLEAARVGPSAQSVAVGKAMLVKAEITLSSARATYEDTVTSVRQARQAGIVDVPGRGDQDQGRPRVCRPGAARRPGVDDNIREGSGRLGEGGARKGQGDCRLGRDERADGDQGPARRPGVDDDSQRGGSGQRRDGPVQGAGGRGRRGDGRERRRASGAAGRR